MMIVKFFLVIILVLGMKLVYDAFVVKSASQEESPIDSTWWNALSDEWKNIFLINQNLSKHRIDIFEIQKGYINRLNKEGEPSRGELNTSLYELHRESTFSLGYPDFYARVMRENHLQANDSVDLASLALLETVYMVNGPSDLSPLRKIRHLKVLIINFAGMQQSGPVKGQVVDLEPISRLNELTVLHCSSSAVTSLKPIKNLAGLVDLECDNTNITSLAPLKRLVNLKRLSFGGKVNTTKDISHLERLEELHVNGCRDVLSIANLKNLKKLSFTENELAIVDGSYRVASLDFLRNLNALMYLDLNHTSYKGSLHVLGELQNLRAVSLPRVSSSEATAFKNTNPDCKILNGYEFEW